MNEKDFSNLTSKSNDDINLSDDDIEALGNMIGDNIGKSIEDNQKDDWQSKPAKKGMLDNLADWITGDYSEKTQGQEVIEAGLITGALEQQQFASEFANDFGEMIRSAVSSDRLNEILEASSEVNVSSINKNQSQTNNRDTHNIDIQAEIRERVLQNIEESKTAREASNYKQFAEFENGFKGGSNPEIFKFSEMSEDEIAKIVKVYRGKAPIEIPEAAKIKTQSKVGYEQISYKWNDGTYKYEARWHTRTPEAPIEQGNTWVIQRTRPGSGGTKPTTELKLVKMSGYLDISGMMLLQLEKQEPLHQSKLVY
jgi:hypothetical protein